MRYQFTPTEKRYDGKMVFKTTYYPNIPESDDDLYITASNEDYLDALAKKSVSYTHLTLPTKRIV